MAITVETVTELDDSIFDSIYADSKSDLEAIDYEKLFAEANPSSDRKKEIFKSRLDRDGYNTFLWKKDNTPILYTNGNVVAEYGWYDGDNKVEFTNLFNFRVAIMGFDASNSKDWFKTNEFYLSVKNHLVNNFSVNGYIIEAPVGSALFTSTKQAQTNGVCQGTYSENPNNNQINRSLVWVY